MLDGKLVMAVGVSGVLLSQDLKTVIDGSEQLLGDISKEIYAISLRSSDGVYLRELWALHHLGLLHSSKLRPERLSYFYTYDEMMNEWKRLGVNLVVDRDPRAIAFARTVGIKTIQLGSTKYPTIAAVELLLRSSSASNLLSELW